MLRTNYIVSPKLQLKYLAAVIAIIILTAVSMYFVFWSSLIHSPGLDRLSAGDVTALEHYYQLNFVWVILILIAAFGLLSVFVFHRIVGPLFVFDRAVKNLSSGDLTSDVSLRKNDELKESAAELQNMIDNIRDAVLEDRRKIKEVMDKSPSDVKEKLSSVTRWFKTE